jgi:hypothetical protein
MRNHFGTWTVWTFNNTGNPNSNGYRFTAVPPGEYYLESTFSAYTMCNADVGGDDSVDSDFNPATRSTPSFVVTSGQVISNIWGGYLPP